MRFQFVLDCVWVVFLTAKVKREFIGQRSDFLFSDRVLSVVYESSLANCVASLDFLVIFCTIYNLRSFSGVPNGAARQNTRSSCRI